MSRTRGVALFLGLACFWGLSFPAIKTGLDFFPPVLFAAFRYEVAAVLLLGFAVLSGRSLRFERRDDVVAVLASGVFLVAGNGMLFVGQQFTTSGVAAIITSLVPILTLVFAALLLPNEGLGPVGVLGVLVAFVGVGIIAQPDPSALFASELVGKGLVAATAVSAAIGSVLVRRTDPSFTDVTFTGWGMLLGGLLLHTGSIVVGEGMADAEFTVTALLAVAYLGVVATAIAFVVYFTLLRTYGPRRVNLVSYVAPMVATLAGVLLLDEAITAVTVAGFVVIVSGFVLLQRRAVRSMLRSVATG